MIMDPEIKKELEVVTMSNSEYINILRLASYALHSSQKVIGFTEFPKDNFTSEISKYSIDNVDEWVRNNKINLNEEYEYDVLDSEGKALVLMNESKRVMLMAIEESYGNKGVIELEKRINKEFKEFYYNKDKTLSDNLKSLLIARK